MHFDIGVESAFRVWKHSQPLFSKNLFIFFYFFFLLKINFFYDFNYFDMLILKNNIIFI